MKIEVLIGILGAVGCAWEASGGFMRQPAPTWQQPAGGASNMGDAPSNDPQTWFARGQAALQAGELDSAEADFRKVAAADPRAGAAFANLGVIAMRRKQWDQALALLQKAERLETLG